MIRFERKVASNDPYLSVGFVDLLILVIGELFCLDLQRALFSRFLRFQPRLGRQGR